MRFPILWFVLASVAAAGSWKTLMSPGALHTSHEQWEGNCDRCHVPYEGIPNGRCLDCHDDLKARIDSESGFHAAVAADKCITCHTDHKGPNGEQTRPDALQQFDHSKTGFSLEGAHGKVECETCHEGPIGEMQPQCGSCHDDPHSSELGPECGDCHVSTGFFEQLKTVEAHTLDMTGGHDGLGCADCHQYGEHLELDVPCAVCHDDAHGGTSSACNECHKVSGFKPAEFDHGPCGCSFPGKHQTVSCLDCHKDFEFTNTVNKCSSCHDPGEAHEADLGECSLCHTATSWKENLFDHNKRSSFAITGKHIEQDCTACHTTVGEFKGAPSACEGCHAESGLQAHGDFGACNDCHTTDGFAPSTFDHLKVTGFALIGQHGTIGCQECHAEKVEGYPSPE